MNLTKTRKERAKGGSKSRHIQIVKVQKVKLVYLKIYHNACVAFEFSGGAKGLMNKMVVKMEMPKKKENQFKNISRA